ncbi:MAG TPA: SCO family protein [Gemmatimonadales bacterium]|nr:SCO family protein [Gemmatimonadales bacterium]
MRPTWPSFTLGIAILSVVSCSRVSRASSDQVAGVRITPAIPKPNFVLTDTHGQQFDFRRDTRGKVTLLFFGYTHCPDVCPLQMANVAAALKRTDTAVAHGVAVVFVTTDSARDPPQRLRQWLGSFDSTFIGLTGRLDRVNAIQAGLRILPQSVREDSGPDYGIAHSAVVIAFTPDDSAHLVYPSGIPAAALARDLTHLVRDAARPGT